MAGMGPLAYDSGVVVNIGAGVPTVWYPAVSSFLFSKPNFWYTRKVGAGKVSDTRDGKNMHVRRTHR